MCWNLHRLFTSVCAAARVAAAAARREPLRPPSRRASSRSDGRRTTVRRGGVAAQVVRHGRRSPQGKKVASSAVLRTPLGQRTRHALDALHRSVNPPRTNARRRPGAIGMRSRPDREPARHRRRALWRDRHCRRLRLCRRSGTAGSRCAGMRPLQQCVPHRSVALRARGKVNRAPVFWRRRRSATTEADRLCRSERESIARVLKDARGEDYVAGLHSALLSC